MPGGVLAAGDGSEDGIPRSEGGAVKTKTKISTSSSTAEGISEPETRRRAGPQRAYIRTNPASSLVPVPVPASHVVRSRPLLLRSEAALYPIRERPIVFDVSVSMRRAPQ